MQGLGLFVTIAALFQRLRSAGAADAPSG